MDHDSLFQWNEIIFLMFERIEFFILITKPNKTFLRVIQDLADTPKVEFNQAARSIQRIGSTRKKARWSKT